MKKVCLLTICYLLFLNNGILAQSKIPDIQSAMESNSLQLSDNIKDNRYYKQLTITIKKGSGIIFFMRSKEFTPYLLFFSNGDGKFFGIAQTKNEKGIEETRIPFIAPADTSFLVILTSTKEHATGKFNYGYKMLEPSEMIFELNFTPCQKLNYLFGQWQANWDLLPTGTAHHNGDDSEDSYDYRVTGNTLLKGSNTEIGSKYQEIMYSSKDTSSTLAFYEKICKNIKGCLDLSDWSIESEEEIENKFFKSDAFTIHKHTTHFISKGTAKDQPLKSFKVVAKTSGVWRDVIPNEVILIFN